MKTKQQKAQILDEAINAIKDSKVLLFADFTGISVEDTKNLRKALKAAGARMTVVKKRLMRVALEKESIDFNPEQYDKHMVTVFSKGDISEAAAPLYKFFKETEKKGFQVLGAYDIEQKQYYDGAMVKAIGQLPSKEILLGQFAGMLLSPLRMFMYIIDQKSKQESAV